MSLLTGDGLKSASMRYKQNNITIYIPVGMDTLAPEQISGLHAY